MSPNTRPHRIAAAAAALLTIASLAGCTPAPDPAEAAVLAYIPSADAGDGAWCDLDWNYRSDVEHCKATVGKSAAAHQLVDAPSVIRRLPAVVGSKDDDGQIVVVRVPYKLYTPVQAYRVLRDPATGRWLVDDYAEVHGDPSDDATVRRSLP